MEEEEEEEEEEEDEEEEEEEGEGEEGGEEEEDRPLGDLFSKRRHHRQWMLKRSRTDVTDQYNFL
jgi:hypothetical protein